ncbi:hypothetical protein [Micromonospora sp. WMMD1082]|uniref:hypothetical protein n=1 Tax=Micromonospora sp. WMMD1082 TaxID=3016104 RepID=UPI002415B164|nr:hypothetical protein [Micromonospora sp. WMMD1082]MDG4793615.1 hypothetical protein [Micromonospora sp. WMMD1082]
MNRTTRTITVTTLLAVAATLAACTDPEEPPITLPSASPSIATTSTPTPSNDPDTNVQRQAIDAYLGAQRAYLKATETADPDYPGLAAHAAGKAYERLRDGVKSLRDKGLRSRGETKFSPSIVSLEPPKTPTKARIRDCMDTRGSQVYKASGEPYNDTPGGFRLVIADLEIVDNTWKVTGIGIHGVGSCSAQGSSSS